jgi:hypothetical protein
MPNANAIWMMAFTVMTDIIDLLASPSHGDEGG